MDFLELAIHPLQILSVRVPATREMAVHVSSINSKKMLSVLSAVHGCRGALGGSACPRQQAVQLQLCSRCLTPGRELCPCRPASSHLKLTAPCVLLPGFWPQLSGQEHRHSVLNSRFNSFAQSAKLLNFPLIKSTILIL